MATCQQGCQWAYVLRRVPPQRRAIGREAGQAFFGGSPLWSGPWPSAPEGCPPLRCRDVALARPSPPGGFNCPWGFLLGAQVRQSRLARIFGQGPLCQAWWSGPLCQKCCSGILVWSPRRGHSYGPTAGAVGVSRHGHSIVCGHTAREESPHSAASQGRGVGPCVLLAAYLWSGPLPSTPGGPPPLPVG